MAYWKILLTAVDGPFDAELRVCEIADTMDAAIAQAREGAGAAFQHRAAAQALSALEMTDPIQAERLFIDSGNFNAYLTAWEGR